MDLTALNQAQKEAVTHGQGPLLVLAGAGSGKTRVLTTRIAYLIMERGVDPHNILAITFTNKAAREMRERVGAMVPDQTGGLWVCTFHAACLRILRKHAGYVGYSPNFVIYATDDQKTVIKTCLKEINLDDKKFTPQAILGVISNAKNMLYGPRELEAKSYDYFSKIACQVYHLYQDKLKQNNALDFDDLLMQTVYLWQNNPEVLEYYQERFKYILVDEYQDTNHAQYRLVNLLAQKHRHLCVVGDPDQSIYGWRGADMQNILSFERDYPEARVITLAQNYRSTGTILASANEVISGNQNRKEKDLWTDGPMGDPIIVQTARNEREESSFVADRIRRWCREGGRKYGDFAVLYRTHALSRVLEEKLLTAGIPYVIVGGLRFYERKEIKDLLAYLRLLVNPWDRVSFQRVVNEPKRGIGPVSLVKILEAADLSGQSPLTLLEQDHPIPGLTGRARSSARELGRVMADLRGRMDLLPVTRLVQMVLEDTGYWEALAAEKSVESETRLENLREFFSVTGEYDNQVGAGSLEDFLSGLALLTDLDQYQEDTDHVTLMTLHSAKGLEFPVIFLVGMEEGVFPHNRSLEHRSELEEERRLCYVGITRARELLYLSHCCERTLYGFTRSNPPSRFLQELPADLIGTYDPLERVTGRGRESAPGSDSDRSHDVMPEQKHVNYHPGQQVIHRKWGPGAILEVRGSGDRMELKIDFPGQGVKTLLACFAPLEQP